MRRIFLWLVVGMACGLSVYSWAEDAPQDLKVNTNKEPIEITADGENRFEGGMAYASGNVVIHYRGDVVYADQISYNSKMHEVTATGNVRIYTADGVLYRADQVTYNFETKKVISSSFLGARERYFVSGQAIQSPSFGGMYRIHAGTVTTDNREKPCYHFKANTIDIYPNDRVVLKNAAMYIGDVPVMWVPYYVYSLGSSRTSFETSIGSSSRWGTFTKDSYIVQWNKALTTSFDVDYFGRRGPGGGVDFKYNPNLTNKSEFNSFWIHDDGNSIDNGIARPVPPKEKRFRFSFKNNSDLGNNLYSQADINVLSDRYVAEDFFPRDFREDRQPDNYADVMYYDPNFTATVLARSQANNLFNVPERKPEFSIELKRQKIPGTPLEYEGDASMVNFEESFDRDSTTKDYSAVRYETWHELLYPKQYFGWLSVTPRAGFRAVYYTHNNSPTDPSPLGDLTREIFDTGVEASFKVSRTWLNVKDDSWGIDGLRHVLEPFVNFAYTPSPNKDTTTFLGYDTNIMNTRLRPLNYDGFNSIDSIAAVTTLRHGFRNQLQTKRDGVNWDLVDWSTYADLDLQRDQYAMVDNAYSEVYNDMTVKPLPWLGLDVRSATGTTKKSFDELDTDVNWQVHPAIDLTLGYDHLHKVPFYPEESNLVTFQSFWRLNESWQFGQEVGFEAANGNVQEQRYSIYRDLTAWTIALNTLVRTSQDVKDEFAVNISFTLKAFPEQSVGLSY